jgi:ribonuclease P protein component
VKLVLLKNNKDFSHERYSRAFSGKFLRIRFARASQNFPRFGFIVPKKIIAKATDRNKIKRRLKSLVRSRAESIKPSDIIIFPSARSLKVKYLDLTDDFNKVLQQAKLWKS